MIPTVLAGQLQEGLCDYIETTFPMSNHAFKDSLGNLLGGKNAVFHAPYVAVRLPFRVAEENAVRFDAILFQHQPYLHQHKAFKRLTGPKPRSTLIATGTGSGKTECFLYPVLEYCYHQRMYGRRGIKALIIYPMNALAADQAKRIAQLIYTSPALRGNVTAGMYVGGYESHASRVMSRERIITDHAAMLADPPDILLTNYKMLDYLLVRPKDAMLWATNGPETLKYIVVDELHTFDGAQGTDLACLLRRLKSRLSTPRDYLCCVGTSATMGTKDSAQHIGDYAGSVFGETFTANPVITEDRLTVGEFFAEHDLQEFSIPTPEQCGRLADLVREGDLNSYLACAWESWLGSGIDPGDVNSEQARLQLCQLLMHHSFMRQLLQTMGDNYVQPEYLHKQLRSKFPELAKLSNPETALNALFALISHARSGTPGQMRPFLTVQVQFWMRELRRLLAKVSADNIEYALEADLNENQAGHYLPVINCRDCGETGWVGIANERNNLTMIDLDTFYNLFFDQDSKIKMLYPTDGTVIPPGLVLAGLCPDCLQLDPGAGGEKCSACGKTNMAVVFPKHNIAKASGKKIFVCPFCGSRHGLSLMGLRSATAISAKISQLYASRFNDDKKLLAFSDNVQDAAHRAGFFNFRTWKFGLRGAIQRFAQDQGNGLPLDVFQNNFITYWREKMNREEFVSFFIPPNMTWMRTYENMLAQGRLGQDQTANFLLEGIKKRLKYEIMLEYGISSRIGRTLEKSGCSVLGFDTAKLTAVADRVREITMNELGALTTKPPEVFRQMVVGFVKIMISKGAFDDPVYNAFTKNSGKTYLLTQKMLGPWMSGVGGGRNTPGFIHQPGQGAKKLWGFDALTGNSPYLAWIEDCADEILLREDVPAGIAQIILAQLIRAEIVVTMPPPARYVVYAISKAAVTVSTQVRQFVCDLCGTVMAVAADNSVLWTGAPCMRGACSGRLYQAAGQQFGYYQKLYSHGHMERIMAREHTGLLKRDQREELERVFKRSGAERKHWDPNVLSCTPTLEMGIDIGDLSTVVLCSIPPTQAQYLQRAGRAGRKDGNALTVAVANAKPHDLYFYAEPLEMIQGIVPPPRVFLRASAVLERQFVAYCMDNWIKSGVSERAIPEQVNTCLVNLTSPQRNIFPFNFLHFVQNHLTDFFHGFINMFTWPQGDINTLDQETIRELELFAQGAGPYNSPMYVKVLEAFISLKEQKDALMGNINQLGELIRIMQGKPRDSSYEKDIADMENERGALAEVVKKIKQKGVFNFMSDEGLLPNYAFPESGIILKAILFHEQGQEQEQDQDQGVREGDAKGKPAKMVFEYQRNASSALSEFAPDNHFYADGKKLKINQIDLTTAQTAKWRLCPNCAYAAENSHVTNVAACPRCGSPAWADAGQVRTMLKAKMVYSHMPYRQTQISDESDNRSATFYCKQLLVDVDEDKEVIRAYRMDNDDFPFGYEFVRKAVMREINFGARDMQGERLTVSGMEDVRKGFIICKYCGRMQPLRGEPKHSFTCRAKNPQPGDHEPYAECLFLYREFVTEALRILVPATTSDFSKVRQESFVAAFMLGMKQYFGNVDHLRATLSEVPVPDADYRKQYFVIFDSVPGGTGYLKQLLQQEEAMIEILEKSLAVLENCSCKNDPQKDGCYHCLYAYRQSRYIGMISRTTAMVLLKQVLSGKGNIELIDKLDKVPVNSLFESELERQFIQALMLMGNENRTVVVHKILVNMKEGYALQVGDCAWEIELQVVLDQQHGVAVTSRADFVLWPRRKSAGQKPVAVFTDGFAFHKNKADDDTLKREAIRRSKNFRVWTLGAKDVHEVFRPQGDYFTRTLEPENMPSGAQMYQRTLGFHGGGEGLQPGKATAMELLMRYLERPDAELVFAAEARAISLSLLDAGKFKDKMAFDDWHLKMQEMLDQIRVSDGEFTFPNCLFGIWSPRVGADLRIFSGIGAAQMKEKKSEASPLVCGMLRDDPERRTEYYEKDWHGFWHFYNLMQFSDRFVGITGIGVQQLVYSSLAPILASVPGADEVAATAAAMGDRRAEAWQDTKAQLFDDQALELADWLQSRQVQAPSSVGYELTGARGAVIGECEMAWEAEKVAALLPEQMEHRAVFVNAGWLVLNRDDDIPASIRGGVG